MTRIIRIIIQIIRTSLSQSIAGFAKGFVCGLGDGVLQMYEKDEKDGFKRRAPQQIKNNAAKVQCRAHTRRILFFLLEMVFGLVSKFGIQLYPEKVSIRHYEGRNGIGFRFDSHKKCNFSFLSAFLPLM
jgi:hypothetical protein